MTTQDIVVGLKFKIRWSDMEVEIINLTVPEQPNMIEVTINSTNPASRWNEYFHKEHTVAGFNSGIYQKI